jgi:hypothetical protein
MKEREKLAPALTRNPIAQYVDCALSIPLHLTEHI